MKKREKGVRIVIIFMIATLLFTGLAGALSQVMAADSLQEAQLETIIKNVNLIKKSVKPEKIQKEGFKKINSQISSENQKLIYSAAKRYDLDYALVMAVVQTESGGNSKSVSATEDYGLMQINECNHDWLREKLGTLDFLNPKDNIDAGCFMLSRLIKSYDGDVAKALMAYNMGGGNAAKLWEQGIYSSDYSNKVLSLKAYFAEELKAQK